MARKPSREAISQALWEEMERDPDIFIMGQEVGLWGGTYAVTKGFYDHFGEKRVRDTPISEAAIIGGAIGAAINGLRPVAELMTINFAFSAMEHIVNQAAKLHYMFGGQMVLPLVIRAPGGGGRQLGATHSQTPDAVFAHFHVKLDDGGYLRKRMVEGFEAVFGVARRHGAAAVCADQYRVAEKCAEALCRYAEGMVLLPKDCEGLDEQDQEK